MSNIFEPQSFQKILSDMDESINLDRFVETLNYLNHAIKFDSIENSLETIIRPIQCQISNNIKVFEIMVLKK